MNQPAECTLSEFAAIAGFRRSYVTELKAGGRLVLTADGKRVRVAESLARIAETRDPSKAGVVARHAAARKAAEPLEAGEPIPTAAEAFGGDGEGEEEAEDLKAQGDGDYQYWRKRNERAKALASERENAVAEGRLLDAGAVTAAAASAAATLRGALESLPVVLGPTLAATSDEAAARAILADAIEHALEEAARQFQGMARATA